MKSSKANVEKRLHSIYEYLLANNQSSIKNLSEIFQVSELTIRRDISRMLETYNIERYHGGVSLKKLQSYSDHLNTPHAEKNFPVFFSSGSPTRELLAKKAAEFIEDEDIIFMNASSTILSILKYVDYNIHASIITNNARFPFVEGIKNVNVIITGGELYEKTHALVGEIATSTLNKIHASKCIMGVHGISAENGLSTLNYQHTQINEKMISMCNGQVIIVAEGIKVGRSLSFISCSIDKVNTLITDSTADPLEVEKLINAGVNVIIVE